MAENNQLEELNNLKSKGVINEQNMNEAEKAKMEKVADNEVSVDSIEQIISEDRLLEVANENAVFANMLKPCSEAGIDIFKQLKVYFQNNKVQPEYLAEEVNEQIKIIRLNINRENSALAFDKNGDIDPDLVKEKIGNGPVPEYLKKYLEEEKEPIKEESKIDPKEVEAFTEKIKNDWFKKNDDGTYGFNDEMLEKFEEMTAEMDSKLEDFDKTAEIVTTPEGESVKVNRQYSAAFNQRVALIRNLEKCFKENYKNPPADFLLSVIPRYRDLANDNLDGCTPEEQAIIREILSTFKTRFDLAVNLGVSILEDTEESKAFLEGRFGITKIALEEAIDKYVSNEKKNVLDVYETALSSIQVEEFVTEYEQMKEQVDLDFEKAKQIEYMQIAISRLRALENEEGTIKAVRSTDEDKRRRKQFIERSYARIKEYNPEYFEEALATYKEKENIDITTETLKDYTIRDRLEKANERLNTGNFTETGKKGVTVYNIVLAKVGLKSKDRETRSQCVDFLLEQMPEIKQYFSIDDLKNGREQAIDSFEQEIFTSVCAKYGDLDQVKKWRDYHDFDMHANQTIEYYINGMFVGIAAGSNAVREKNLPIIDSKEFKDDVQRKISEEYTSYRDRRLFEDLVRDIEKYQFKKEFSEEGLTKEEEIELVRTTICATVLYEGSDNNYQKKRAKNLKAILADYIPDAFDTNGELIEDELEKHYNNYLEKSGYYYDTDKKSLDDKFDEMTDRINDEIGKIELGGNPLKKFKDEREIISRKDIRASAVDVHLEAFKFVKYIESRLPESEYSEEIRGSLKRISEKNKSCMRSFFNALKKTKDRPWTDDLDDFIDQTNTRIKKIEEGKFDDDKYFTLIKDCKTLVAETKLNNYEKQFSDLDKIEDKDVQKEIISLYLGMKEDIDYSLIKKDVYKKFSGQFKNYLRKISPDLIGKDGKVDEQALLAKYNELFDKKETSLKNLYRENEDKVLYEFLQEYENQVIHGVKENDRGIPVDLVNNFLQNKDHFILGKLNMKIGKNSIESSMKLFKGMYSGIVKQSHVNFSQADEIDLVTNLTLVLNNLEIVNYGRAYLNDKEQKLENCQRQILETARKSIKNIFLDIENEDGSIDLKKLNSKFKKYIDEKNPTLTDGIDDPDTFVGMLLGQALEEKEMLGPLPRKEYEEKDIDSLVSIVEDIKMNSQANIENDQKSIAYMYRVLTKTAREIDNKYAFNKIDKRFSNSISFIDSKIMEEANRLDVSEDMANKLQLIAAEKFMDRYDKGGTEVTKKLLASGKITENAEKLKNVMISYATIQLCEKNPEGNEGILNRAQKILGELAPDAIVDGNIDNEALMKYVSELNHYRFKPDDYNKFEIIAGKKLSSYMVHTLVEETIDRRYINAIREARENQVIEAPITQTEMDSIVQGLSEELMVNNPGERLATEIVNSEPDIPEISDEDVKQVIQERGEDIEIGSPEEPTIEPKDKQITDEEAKPAFDRTAEDVVIEEETVIEEDQGGPKVAQGETSTTIVAEDISVEEPVQENKALAVQEKNVFKSIFNKVSFAIKSAVKNVTDRLGITSNNADSSNADTTTTSSSSGGVDKSAQDASVKNLTGYDQIHLVNNMNQAKNEETTVQKREEAIEERDDEIGG